MAGSTWVYVVLSGRVDEKPVAGFTVKRELVTWLQGLFSVGNLRIFRIPDADGRWGRPITELSAAELLKGGEND